MPKSTRQIKNHGPSSRQQNMFIKTEKKPQEINMHQSRKEKSQRFFNNKQQPINNFAINTLELDSVNLMCFYMRLCMPNKEKEDLVHMKHADSITINQNLVMGMIISGMLVIMTAGVVFKTKSTEPVESMDDECQVRNISGG
jgi:hypothetical protein